MKQIHFTADAETLDEIAKLAEKEHRSKASVVRLLVQIGLSVSQEFPNLLVAANTTADNQILHNLLHFPAESKSKLV